MKNSILIRAMTLASSLLLQLNTLCFEARGAAGDVDLSFNPGSGIDGTIRVVALQPDGKVIIGGEFTTVKGLGRQNLARLNADGSGDATFDAGAGTVVDRYVSAIAVQADGKVIFTRDNPYLGIPPFDKAGRLNSDGSVDDSFVPDTGIHPYGSGFTCVAAQPDGRIVLGGYFIDFYVDEEGFGYYYRRSLMIRLNADGSADPGFTKAIGQDYNTWISSLVLQSDGKILIGGHINTTIHGTDRYGTARHNADGSLDGSFVPGAEGYVETIAVQPDGRILIGGGAIGSGADRNGLARLNPDGSLDGSFHPGTDGNTALISLAVQPDGKVLIGGTVHVNGISRNGLARLHADGTLDNSFNTGTGTGSPNNSGVRFALQPDGKVFIAGAFTTFNEIGHERIARLAADGSVDATFDPGAGINGWISALSLQPDGRVLIGGTFTAVHGRKRNCIARLHSDGSLDESFDPGAGLSDPYDPRITALVLQADGRIIVGGRFISFSGTPRNRIAQLNADGSLDCSFNPVTGGHELDIHCLALYPGGKLLVAGDPKLANGASPNGVFLLDSNGSMDSSFAADVLGNASADYTGINALAVQPDGRIVAGGYFARVTEFGDDYNRLLIRLNADGSRDTNFTDTGLGPEVRAITLQPDGRLLVGSARFDGMVEPAISRLNANGSPDGGFNPGSGSPWDVNTIALQPDGRILAYQNGLARLHADGSPDNNFHRVPLAPDTVLLQPDGKLLVAGSFRTVNGVLLPRIARLYGDSQPPISFAIWAASFGLSGSAARPDADPDLDGLPNGAEYILGEVPIRMWATESSHPAATTRDGQMKFTFFRADASESPDIALSVETSNDLATWSTDFTIGATSAASSPGVSITENGTAPDTITITIPQGTDKAKFARLKAAVSP